ITDLAGQVARIRPEELSRRLACDRGADELTPIVAGVNSMLDRLDEAFEREKRLAASAAHELRTPIAEMRAVTELALDRERSAAEYREALATSLGAAERMGVAVDAVLRLARVQSGRERPALEAVKIRAALRPAWERWMIPLAVRGVHLDIDIPQDAIVKADRAMLEV